MQKKIITLFLLNLFTWQTVFAREALTLPLPKQDIKEPSLLRAKVYGKIKLSEPVKNVTLYHSTPETYVRLNPLEAEKLLEAVEETDKIIIQYKLTEAENRWYHIERLEEQAKLEEQKASSFFAKMSEIEIIGEKEILEHEEKYKTLAKEALNKADEYRKRADGIKMGDKAPVYNFTEVVDSKELAIEKIHNNFVGSKVVTRVSYIPNTAQITRQLLKRAIGMGILGVITSVAISVKEAAAQNNINKIENLEIKFKLAVE